MQNCYVSNYGSMFFLQQVTAFTDDYSTFSHGAAKQGGAIYCDSCSMTLRSTKFSYFKALNGGTLVLDNRSNLDAEDVAILSSYAIS
jgi:predicted outer membrane repeat protein